MYDRPIFCLREVCFKYNMCTSESSDLTRQVFRTESWKPFALVNKIFITFIWRRAGLSPLHHITVGIVRILHHFETSRTQPSGYVLLIFVFICTYTHVFIWAQWKLSIMVLIKVYHHRYNWSTESWLYWTIAYHWTVVVLTALGENILVIILFAIVLGEFY